jgi:DNA-directed RNA polymerase subunit RPC12/RpoP
MNAAQAIKHLESLRDKLLGPNRTAIFTGADIGRMIQRTLTDIEEGAKNGAQPKQVGKQKGRKSRVEICAKCKTRMRYTWGRTEGKYRTKHFVCPACNHKQTRKDRVDEI